MEDVADVRWVPRKFNHLSFESTSGTVSLRPKYSYDGKGTDSVIKDRGWIFRKRDLRGEMTLGQLFSCEEIRNFSRHTLHPLERLLSNFFIDYSVIR